MIHSPWRFGRSSSSDAGAAWDEEGFADRTKRVVWTKRRECRSKPRSHSLQSGAMPSPCVHLDVKRQQMRRREGDEAQLLLPLAQAAAAVVVAAGAAAAAVVVAAGAAWTKRVVRNCISGPRSAQFAERCHAIAECESRCQTARNEARGTANKEQRAAAAVVVAPEAAAVVVALAAVAVVVAPDAAAVVVAPEAAAEVAAAPEAAAVVVAAAAAVVVAAGAAWT